MGRHVYTSLPLTRTRLCLIFWSPPSAYQQQQHPAVVVLCTNIQMLFPFVIHTHARTRCIQLSRGADVLQPRACGAFFMPYPQVWSASCNRPIFVMHFSISNSISHTRAKKEKLRRVLILEHAMPRRVANELRNCSTFCYFGEVGKRGVCVKEIDRCRSLPLELGEHSLTFSPKCSSCHAFLDAF